MNILYKALNKFNGNLCFAGRTDRHQDILIEVDRGDHTISYVYPTQNITDICLNNSNSYLIAFSNTWLGKFENGVLNETYWNVLTVADMVIRSSNGDTYVLNRTSNTLSKIGDWTYTLPDSDLKDEGKILFRESDSSIIYYNNSRLHIIWDNVTGGKLFKTINLSGNGEAKVVISGEFNPGYTYLNYEDIYGSDLEQISTSSSETSLSESSDSDESSSSSIDSSSSSSSSSFGESSSSSTSSSSSFGESSSSSEAICDVTLPYNTSATTPKHIITWSHAEVGFEGWKAFDGDTGTEWKNLLTASENITIDLGSLVSDKKRVVRYGFFDISPGGSISAVALKGSNDSIAYTTIDSRAVTTAQFWHYYNVNIPGGIDLYRYYKLEFVQSIVAPMRISEIELCESG